MCGKTMMAVGFLRAGPLGERVMEDRFAGCNQGKPFPFLQNNDKYLVTKKR